MSALLGVPVVPISAVKDEGVSELVDRAVQAVKTKNTPKVTDFCGYGAVHRCIHSTAQLIEDHAAAIGVSARFCATKLIEGDEDFAGRLGLNQNERELIEHSVAEMESETGLDRNAALADIRYTFIENVVREAVTKGVKNREHRRSLSIDRILTGKYTAFPVFLGVMFLVFYLTFGVVGSALSDLLLRGIDALSGLVDRALEAYGINPIVHSLIIDGIFAGVGSVLSFLPLINAVFFLSILEDADIWRASPLLWIGRESWACPAAVRAHAYRFRLHRTGGHGNTHACFRTRPQDDHTAHPS